MDSDALLTVRGLKTYFYTTEGIVKAVNGANLEVGKQKTLGVVGESGCGKSVMSHSILNIVSSPGKIIEGEILYQKSEAEQIDLTTLKPEGKEMRSIRGNEIAMIFQEPMSALSPVHTIGNQLIEGIMLHSDLTKRQARQAGIEMLRQVGIPDPANKIDVYTYELSGGMRQRAMIAMALACRPKLLIADEPTTALDVTIQAQILDLMKELQEDLQMSVMIITHDLGVIAEMADDVTVMYLGKAVERAPVREIFRNAKHPYTQALLRSLPRIERKGKKKLASVSGTVPDAYSIPSGCPFHPRCEEMRPGRCDQRIPGEIDLGDGHIVACLRYEEVTESA